MLNLLQIILVIQNFLELVIFLSNQYVKFILSFNKALNLKDDHNLNSEIENKLISTDFNIRLNENPNFKDNTGYYIYHGFEIF